MPKDARNISGSYPDMAIGEKTRESLLARAKILINEQERFLDLLEKNPDNEILGDMVATSFKELHAIFLKFGEKDADRETAGGIIHCIYMQYHYATLLRKHSENEKEVV